MTDQPTSPYGQPQDPPPSAPGDQTWAAPAPGPAYGGAPAPAPAYGAPAPATGPIGRTRSTGLCILLFIVTLGIYGLFWYYNTHEEMKRHTGEGIGGLLALVIGFFVSIVMAFLSPYEVGRLYERRSQRPPVSALTGLWILLPLVGGIIWFVKTNGALNDYWRSLGAA
jgi:hypothetical protein